MLEFLNNLCLAITDPLLNWLLILPRDVLFFVVSIATSALITFSRKWVTNQDWLRRADEDAKRQSELAKEAKQRGDKAAAQRHNLNMGMIRMRGLKYEGKPLLIAILPIALLATWAMNRIAFEPPRANETVEIKMYFPRAAMDGVVHLVPQEGIEVENGWVQRIGEDVPFPLDTPWDRGVAKVGGWFGAGFEYIVVHVFGGAVASPPLMGGLATWKVKAKESPESYRLTFFYKGKTYTKEFLVGRRVYASQVDAYGLDAPVQAIEQALKPRMLFGFVGGLGALGGLGLWVPPWLMAYLLIACTFVPLLKKIFKIY